MCSRANCAKWSARRINFNRGILIFPTRGERCNERSKVITHKKQHPSHRNRINHSKFLYFSISLSEFFSLLFDYNYRSIYTQPSFPIFLFSSSSFQIFIGRNIARRRGKKTGRDKEEVSRGEKTSISKWRHIDGKLDRWIDK